MEVSVVSNTPESLLLAEEIVRGIEDSSMAIDRALLKSTRLARLIRDDSAGEWLKKEREGYGKADRDTQRFQAMKRQYVDARYDIYGSAIVVAREADSFRVQLASLRIPDVSGDWANKVNADAHNAIAQTRASLLRHEKVLASVEQEIHGYVVQVLHAASFGIQSSKLFDAARAEIDGLLVRIDPDIPEKLDFAMQGLIDGAPEAISAGMNSLRRLLVTFADIVFPSTSAERSNPSGGQPIKLGEANYLNRVKAFIDDNCSSDSRRTRLKQELSNINARLSSGVHDEVTLTEAKFLLLNCYILCGEIVQMRSTLVESSPASPLA
ncbi:hypothetical protein JF66_21780 [Cryobacterium sp. MLB-32]|nr:hypothetical protein JF66_21780 [Cryobacterium sp. MLB-32]